MGGVRQWTLKEPFRYVGSREITVPAGFITDLASTPRIAWNLFPPDGSYLKAAICHDFAYAKKIMSRKEADEMFLEAMKAAGVSWVSRWIVYSAVRAGGWRSWNAGAAWGANGPQVRD